MATIVWYSKKWVYWHIFGQSITYLFVMVSKMLTWHTLSLTSGSLLFSSLGDMLWLLLLCRSVHCMGVSLLRMTRRSLRQSHVISGVGWTRKVRFLSYYCDNYEALVSLTAFSFFLSFLLRSVHLVSQAVVQSTTGNSLPESVLK